MGTPAIKRITHEYKELIKQPSPYFIAAPLKTNMFEWHFTLRGPRDSEFQGGKYHGKLLLPSDYPFSPPDFIFLTPNGRYEVGTKICLSITRWHVETWAPTWSIRKMIEAVAVFMVTPPEGAVGALDYTPEIRKQLATASQSWICKTCNVSNEDLIPGEEDPEQVRLDAARNDLESEKEAKKNQLKNTKNNNTNTSSTPTNNQSVSSPSLVSSSTPKMAPSSSLLGNKSNNDLVSPIKSLPLSNTATPTSSTPLSTRTNTSTLGNNDSNTNIDNKNNNNNNSDTVNVIPLDGLESTNNIPPNTNKTNKISQTPIYTPKKAIQSTQTNSITSPTFSLAFLNALHTPSHQPSASQTTRISSTQEMTMDSNTRQQAFSSLSLPKDLSAQNINDNEDNSSNNTNASDITIQYNNNDQNTIDTNNNDNDDNKNNNENIQSLSSIQASSSSNIYSSTSSFVSLSPTNPHESFMSITSNTAPNDESETNKKDLSETQSNNSQISTQNNNSEQQSSNLEPSIQINDPQQQDNNAEINAFGSKTPPSIPLDHSNTPSLIQLSTKVDSDDNTVIFDDDGDMIVVPPNTNDQKDSSTGTNNTNPPDNNVDSIKTNHSVQLLALKKRLDDEKRALVELLIEEKNSLLHQQQQKGSKYGSFGQGYKGSGQLNSGTGVLVAGEDDKDGQDGKEDVLNQSSKSSFPLSHTFNTPQSSFMSSNTIDDANNNMNNVNQYSFKSIVEDDQIIFTTSQNQSIDDKNIQITQKQSVESVDDKIDGFLTMYQGYMTNNNTLSQGLNTFFLQPQQPIMDGCIITGGVKSIEIDNGLNQLIDCGVGGMCNDDVKNKKNNTNDTNTNNTNTTLLISSYNTYSQSHLYDHERFEKLIKKEQADRNKTKTRPRDDFGVFDRADNDDDNNNTSNNNTGDDYNINNNGIDKNNTKIDIHPNNNPQYSCHLCTIDNYTIPSSLLNQKSINMNELIDYSLGYTIQQLKQQNINKMRKMIWNPQNITSDGIKQNLQLFQYFNQFDKENNNNNEKSDKVDHKKNHENKNKNNEFINQSIISGDLTLWFNIIALMKLRYASEKISSDDLTQYSLQNGHTSILSSHNTDTNSDNNDDDDDSGDDYDDNTSTNPFEKIQPLIRNYTLRISSYNHSLPYSYILFNSFKHILIDEPKHINNEITSPLKKNQIFSKNGHSEKNNNRNLMVSDLQHYTRHQVVFIAALIVLIYQIYDEKKVSFKVDSILNSLFGPVEPDDQTGGMTRLKLAMKNPEFKSIIQRGKVDTLKLIHNAVLSQQLSTANMKKNTNVAVLDDIMDVISNHKDGKRLRNKKSSKNDKNDKYGKNNTTNTSPFSSTRPQSPTKSNYTKLDNTLIDKLPCFGSPTLPSIKLNPSNNLSTSQTTSPTTTTTKQQQKSTITLSIYPNTLLATDLDSTSTANNVNKKFLLEKKTFQVLPTKCFQDNNDGTDQIATKGLHNKSNNTVDAQKMNTTKKTHKSEIKINKSSPGLPFLPHLDSEQSLLLPLSVRSKDILAKLTHGSLPLHSTSPSYHKKLVQTLLCMKSNVLKTVKFDHLPHFSHYLSVFKYWCVLHEIWKPNKIPFAVNLLRSYNSIRQRNGESHYDGLVDGCDGRTLHPSLQPNYQSFVSLYQAFRVFKNTLTYTQHRRTNYGHGFSIITPQFNDNFNTYNTTTTDQTTQQAPTNSPIYPIMDPTTISQDTADLLSPHSAAAMIPFPLVMPKPLQNAQVSPQDLSATAISKLQQQQVHETEGIVKEDTFDDDVSVLEEKTTTQKLNLISQDLFIPTTTKKLRLTTTNNGYLSTKVAAAIDDKTQYYQVQNETFFYHVKQLSLIRRLQHDRMCGNYHDVLRKGQGLNEKRTYKSQIISLDQYWSKLMMTKSSKTRIKSKVQLHNQSRHQKALASDKVFYALSKLKDLHDSGENVLDGTDDKNKNKLDKNIKSKPKTSSSNSFDLDKKEAKKISKQLDTLKANKKSKKKSKKHQTLVQAPPPGLSLQFFRYIFAIFILWCRQVLSWVVLTSLGGIIMLIIWNLCFTFTGYLVAMFQE